MTNGNGHAPESERMAPHSIEAEESVLGSLLVNEDDWFLIADKLTPDDFFIIRNGWVWAAMQRIKGRRGHIDNVTVCEELAQHKDGMSEHAPTQLQAAGGPSYITYLITHTPGSIYTETYADIVARAAVRRRMLDGVREIARLAQEESADIDDTIASAEQAFFKSIQQPAKRSDALLKAELVVHDLQLQQRFDGKSFGVPSGFTEVDKITGGFEKGYLIYLAARPGMGKTAWQVNVALNAARRGARVGFLSLEMSKQRLVSRMIAVETGISTTKQRKGDLTPEEWVLYYEAQDRLSKLPIVLDYVPGLTPDAMRNKASRWHGEHGIDLLIADYIGLMTVPGIRTDNRNALVTVCSGMCQRICGELNIPVLMASQLSRDLEKRKDKRPMLSDLRDSGSLEQDADMVIFIYRDEVYNENTQRPNQADIIVAKNRDGATGTVALYFRKDLTQFSDLAKAEVDFTPYNNDGYRDARGKDSD